MAGITRRKLAILTFCCLNLSAEIAFSRNWSDYWKKRDPTTAPQRAMNQAANQANRVVDNAANRANGVVDNAANRANGVVDNAANRANGVVDNAANRANGVVDNAANRANGVVDNAANRANGVVDNAANRANGVVDNAANCAKGVVDKAANRANGVVDKAADRGGQLLHEAADRGEGLVDKAAGRGSQLLHEAAGRGEGLVDKAADRGSQLLHEAAGRGEGLVDKAADRGGQLLHEAADRGEGLVDKAADRGGQLLHEAADRGEGLVDKAAVRGDELISKAVKRAEEFTAKTGEDLTNKATQLVDHTIEKTGEEVGKQFDHARAGFVEEKEAFLNDVEKKYNGVKRDMVYGACAVGVTVGVAVIAYKACSIANERHADYKNRSSEVSNVLAKATEESVLHNAKFVALAYLFSASLDVSYEKLYKDASYFQVVNPYYSPYQKSSKCKNSLHCISKDFAIDLFSFARNRAREIIELELKNVEDLSYHTDMFAQELLDELPIQVPIMAHFLKKEFQSFDIGALDCYPIAIKKDLAMIRRAIVSNLRSPQK